LSWHWRWRHHRVLYRWLLVLERVPRVLAPIEVPLSVIILLWLHFASIVVGDRLIAVGARGPDVLAVLIVIMINVQSIILIIFVFSSIIVLILSICRCFLSEMQWEQEVFRCVIWQWSSQISDLVNTMCKAAGLSKLACSAQLYIFAHLCSVVGMYRANRLSLVMESFG